MLEKKGFAGDKKVPMKSLLAKVERRFIDRNIHRFPRWIEGYHLTLMTLVWSAGMILFGWLAARNVNWLWASSLMLFMQWFTDSFDGSLGRHRDTGIPKWGYFMDHLLDYLFMGCIVMGYAFLVSEHSRFLLLVLAFLFGVFMAASFLSFAATNEFKVTYLGVGPTEIRIFFIFVNACIIAFGAGWFERSLPYVLGLSIGILCIVIYRTQKYIWNLDMTEKRRRQESNQ